ncbi:MAG: glutamate-cysteine ligase family protein [Xanthomonadales bacterium]|nr:glutamate-cysteine ligase family protein [Xanthomonadales bacterium]
MPTIDPVTPQPHLHAFAGYGIELEYMIVEHDALSASPMADRLLAMQAGEVVNEVDMGDLAWSNELVLHVIELKTNGPAVSLEPLNRAFSEAVRDINAQLSPMQARLLPSAMHPLFDPETETRLWPHGQNEIYAAYDRIFTCRGHGWSNLQSMHINLPFFDDEEFRRLHAAIRIVLPLIPALSAASPLVEGACSGWMDTRLKFYRDNQRRIPEIAGRIVPEAVESMADYHARILEPTYRAIAPHDPDGILAEDWLNSRGAIARFERQTIEIRIIDIQECPRADLAIAEAVVALVRRIYHADEILARGQQLATEALADQLFAAARDGGAVEYDHSPWLSILTDGTARTGRSLWLELLGGLDVSETAADTLSAMLERGSLAEAICTRLGEHPTREAVVECYRELAGCLEENRLFQP